MGGLRNAIIGLALFAAGGITSSLLRIGLHPAPACVLSEDARRGRVWAPTCESCHDIAASEPKDLQHSSGGPDLRTAYMSLAGTQPAVENPTAVVQQPYPPLAAARDAGVIWSDENLFQYLRDPRGFLERMTGKSFAEPFYMNFYIGNEDSRRDVIAYLRTIKNHPECD